MMQADLDVATLNAAPAFSWVWAKRLRVLAVVASLNRGAFMLNH